MDRGSEFHIGGATGDPVPATRVRQRMDRQARVGILRNLNQPAMPPPHRPPLMGRWLHMRSSRRPLTAGLDDPVELAAPAVTTSPLIQSGDNGIARINIDQLMASVEGMGTAQRQRAPFATDPTSAGPDRAAPPDRQPRHPGPGAESPQLEAGLPHPDDAAPGATTDPAPDTRGALDGGLKMGLGATLRRMWGGIARSGRSPG